jgi:molybdopterin molybdotransferase
MTPALPSYAEAVQLVYAYAANLARLQSTTERVLLADALGRVLAQPIHADRDQPPFPRSTRDGFACRAREASKHEFLRIAGSIHAGQPPSGPLPKNSTWEIMTGAPVPAGADAVAMVEHVEVLDGKLRMLAPRKLKNGENIVAQGAQARAGELLLSNGALISPQQIALAAACGFSTLEVYRRARVAILATGDELVPVDADPAPGQIRNSNAPMLAAQVAEAGGEPWILPAAADTAKALDAALAQAKKADLLLISGGVSAGKFDLVEPALARAGATFHFTGVRIQPGKPLVFGELPRGKERSALPFFGLPGNPVSTAVTFRLFASLILSALAGNAEAGPRFAMAWLAVAIPKQGKSGLTRFLPAYCDFDASAHAYPVVYPVPTAGSGDLASLARANCFLVIPEDASRLKIKTNVSILLI